jgi:hypothetical protein
MSEAKQFSRKLEELWNRRTTTLRSHVIPRGRGKALGFTKAVRTRLIGDLLDVASRILIRREARSEFDVVKRGRRLRRIKGRGLLARGNETISWAESALRGPIVYSFWRGSRCLYVGKGNSWTRLKAYAKSAYLKEADSIEVHLIKGKSQLGKAECLATHLFNPRDNKVRAARIKWGKACPVCRKHDMIRRELLGLFKLR